MNRILLTLLFLFAACSFLFSQEFEVRSFAKDPKDISAIRYPKKDVNNQPAAIIKVRTSLKDLNFECNSGFVGDPEFKDGEIWLYVSPRERRLKFMKEGFMTTDYVIKEVIEPSCVYVLELVNKFQAPIKAGASLGFIVIKSQPSGAQVKINGEATGTTTPFQKPLKPGQYSFDLTKTLYQTYSGTFTLVAGKTITEDIKLEPNFGSLSISTSPEQEASIYIDDKLEEKTTPATFDQIPSGSHTLTLEKELYETVTQNFIIENGEKTVLNIPLKPTFGEVEITATEGVEIWIDQQRVGRGNYSGRFVKGVHLIEGKATNYNDFSETVTVEVGRTHQVNVNLIPITGILTIMTEPLEANVTLDGVNKGKTPLILENLIIGDHSIRLTKTGYGEVAKQISLQENQTLEINEKLPTGMEITINSTPSGSRLQIDGVKKGITPFSGTLSYGEHSLTFNKVDYSELNQSITIDGSKEEFRYYLSKILPDKGSFTDRRDGKIYKWVKIGNQIWMAQNLNYKTENSWCYDNKTSNCDTYGRLYNWQTAVRACPSGWHLPSRKEWTKLKEFLGGKSTAGGKMKEAGTAHWASPNTGATNSSGFTALPGGGRYKYGNFRYLTERTYFWSSSESYATSYWNRYLDYLSVDMCRGYRNETNGFSVRCLQD